jgi:hypothetical protein
MPDIVQIGQAMVSMQRLSPAASALNDLGQHLGTDDGQLLHRDRRGTHRRSLPPANTGRAPA